MSAVLENIQDQATDLQVVSTSSSALILDSASMDSMMRLADHMAKGRSTIPDHLKGSSSDCMAVVMQAIQWKMNPYAVAQKTHLVNGTLGYEAQLVNSVVQSSGVTQDRFSYEWFGAWENVIGKTKVVDVPAKGTKGSADYKKEYQFRVPDYDMRAEEGLGIRVSATLKGETEPRVLTLLLVQASVRNSPLWASDPKQQLAYLAVKRWARLFTPDVILGVYTPDELEEIAPPAKAKNMGDADVIPKVPAALLAEAEAAAKKGVSEYQKFWSATGQENRKLLAPQHEGFKATAIDADSARTVDVTPTDAAKPAAEMDGLIADLDAAADGGLDSFESAWQSLSQATKDKLPGIYDRIASRFTKTGGA